VVKADVAIQPVAPSVYPDDADVKNNIRFSDQRGNQDKANAALSQCDVVVEAEYQTPTIHHCCLETHGVVVDYHGGTSATVFASTQGTFAVPGDAAAALGLDESAVVSIVQNMGGGFGSKFGIGIEGKLACQLAKKAASPVKLMLTRQDEFLLAGNRSASWQKFRAGARKDGKVVAIDATQFKMGGIGTGSLAGQPYIYHFPSIYRQVSSIHTNIDSSRSMRAPGNPEASFAIESLMDELAFKLGIDPVEFRRKNVNNPVHPRQLERGKKEIGWEKRLAAPGSWPGTLKRGFGCATGVWGGGGGPQCQVDVAIARDGSVTVSVGSQDLGTGTRTYLRAIVAEELGLQMDDILEKIGDSRLGAANTSGGSTTTASLAPAVKDAAVSARKELAKRLAAILNASADQITFENGQVNAGQKSLQWKQACAALPAAGISVRGTWQPDLASRGTHGACFAEVEVDVETGHVQVVKMVQVQDVGLPLNRMAIESQINGGLIQGLGMALLEGRVMDRELGVMVNPSFMDYKIPGCLEIPELVPLIDDEDTRQAVVGVGEPPAIPGAGAIANAVFNACGVRVRDLPITPDKILSGLYPRG
jgi:xanthine dehydrogenase YagR molybdenum-binding subunit